MYFYANNIIYQNKSEAILKNTQENRSYLYYHDEVWDKIDWTIEPEGSLDFHYKMQAQRIRDEYDYVILCYSGGYDSTNILEASYYNNIKLDKIVTQGAFKQDSFTGSDENQNGEIYKNVFPNIKQFGLDNILQVIDHSEFYSDITKLSVYEMGENWVDDIGDRYSPHNWFWRDIHKYVVPEKYQDKKVAIIFGTDKPHLVKNSAGLLGFSFNSVALTSYARYKNPRQPNIEDVNFYWDPNYPLIILKQLHTMKKLNITGSQTEKSIHDAIYNLKNPLVHKSEKSMTTRRGLRDNFLFGDGFLVAIILSLLF